MSRKAWRVKGFGGEGIVWAETRGKARMIGARSVSDAGYATIGGALAGLTVKRAPEHDAAGRRFAPDLVIDEEHLRWEARNDR